MWSDPIARRWSTTGLTVYPVAIAANLHSRNYPAGSSPGSVRFEVVEHALAVVKLAIVPSFTLVIHRGDTPYAAREIPRSASIGWKRRLNRPTFRGIKAITIPTGIGTIEQTALG
jgi:hypothetical protein